jgi:hypothetical protein
MREPPITVTCDCGTVASLAYGERWTCANCGKTWNTSQIPRQEYDELLRHVRRYKLMVLVPPIVLAVILIPLGVLVDIRFAFLLFLLEIGFALLVIPPLRRRASQYVLTQTPNWELRPE